jgi:hypothetical protein
MTRLQLLTLSDPGWQVHNTGDYSQPAILHTAAQQSGQAIVTVQMAPTTLQPIRWLNLAGFNSPQPGQHVLQPRRQCSP